LPQAGLDPFNNGRSMSQLKIAIILSTTRATRFGHKVGEWLLERAKARDDLSFEIVDLRDYPMPFFDEVASNAWVPTKNAEGLRWQKKVAEFDGYIFVTAEYNRGVPAVLKNALDYDYTGWFRKPAAYVGYGSVGAARAIEQLRLINVELQMVPTRSGVHIQGADFMAVLMQGKPLSELGYLDAGVKTMLDELAWWTTTTKAARESK
jgi:NAD(P)H-dependent FMN reductase